MKHRLRVQLRGLTGECTQDTKERKWMKVERISPGENPHSRVQYNSDKQTSYIPGSRLHVQSYGKPHCGLIFWDNIQMFWLVCPSLSRSWVISLIRNSNTALVVTNPDDVGLKEILEFKWKQTQVRTCQDSCLHSWPQGMWSIGGWGRILSPHDSQHVSVARQWQLPWTSNSDWK